MPDAIADYMQGCRQRVPEFVAANYAWTGAIALNRRAFGRDILVAPFNFLMGFPNFVVQATAVVVDVLGAHRTAEVIARCHLGLPTEVQRMIRRRLMTELLQLPEGVEYAGDRVRQWVKGLLSF